MSLEDRIYDFIQSKREGTNWDFKEIPHANNAKLLHDILSMANCNCDDDRYVVLGVSDPKEGCQITGLTEGQTNRKQQTDLIDFLRKINFAGDIRPEVEIKTIQLEGIDIDVIIISNKPQKPYYITTDYGKGKPIVRAYHIYTRNLDANTPIDNSADLFDIEKMWRERFGLDLSPIDRMKNLLLKPKEWEKDLGNKNYAYHTQFPEFRIEFSELRETQEVFGYYYMNSKCFYGIALFMYKNTILFELDYLTVNEMSQFIGTPKAQYITFEKGRRNWYFYFDMSSLEGMFHYFITDGHLETDSRGCNHPFMYFKNAEEQLEFDEYLIGHNDAFFQLEVDDYSKLAKQAMEKNKFKSVIDPNFIGRVHKMYKKWKSLR